MRRPIVCFATLVIVVLMISMVACSGGGEEVTEVQVRLNEYSIVLDQSSIPAGSVKFEIENAGTETHEVVLEPVGASDEPFEKDGKESEVEDILAGDKVTLEWTLDTPGEYQLSCYIEDHAEKGMITPFTVAASE